MSELRWILLAVGVVFLILLTAWESRRSRRARVAARERARAMTDVMPFEHTAAASPQPGGPQLGELPAQVGEDFALEAVHYQGDDAGVLDVPMRIDDGVAVPLDPDTTDETLIPERYRQAMLDASAPSLGAAPPDPPPASVQVQATDLSQEALASGEVSVEWPPEEQRRIVSVRIVAIGEQRLSGRTTRQALAACGFVHGPYRIFHQPDSQGHALLSCASLSKPGMFDPSSMDYQRYSGLSLFTVLPGPVPARQAVDHLLDTAVDLSERLQARLQNDAGHALDAQGIAELRSRYRELDATAGPPA